MNINPALLATGTPVFGAIVSPTEFQAAIRYGLFKNLVPDPQNLEGTNAKHHQDLAGYASLRAKVQRLVTGTKAANLKSYAPYIEKMAKTGDGFTPQIVLWSPKPLQVECDADTGVACLVAPHGTKFVCLDGDTQTAARALADRNDPGAFDTQMVKVVIVHGLDEERAAQIFSDANTLGVKVNASLAISLDTRDDATRLAKLVEKRVPELNGKINRQKRQLKQNDTDVLTMSALRTSVACFIEGIAGVQSQNKPVDIKPDEAAAVHAAAVAWFAAVVKVLNGALTPEKRATTFAAAPGVWAALGALGNDAMKAAGGPNLLKPITDADMAFLARQKLEAVDWTRDERWLTHGAKIGKTGVSLGGPKEAGGLIYAALKNGAFNTATPLAA